MSISVKKGDTVLVITGKDKGKTGKVLDVFPNDNKVLVDGINIVTKHKKARTQQEKSEIIKKNAPIQASNVMVVCPVCGKATRVAHKEIEGKKVRTCKKCSASLDKEFVKTTKKEAKKNISSAKEEAIAEKPVAKKTTASKAKKTTASKTKSTGTKSSGAKKTTTQQKSTSKSSAKTEA